MLPSNSPIAHRAEQGEFVRGWPVVLAATLGVGLGLAPVPFYTVGVFAPEWVKTFGWSYAQVLGGFTTMTLVIVVVGPLVGALTDRLGVRRVALTSTLLFGLAFMALALATRSIIGFYLLWAVLALAGAGSLPMTWTRAVSATFRRRRGLALGIAMTGTGLFGFVVKPLAAWLIAQLGWRLALVSIGALPILIVLPVAFWGLRDDTKATSAGLAIETDAVTGRSFGAALRDWRFYLLGIAALLISFAISGPIPNIEGILRTQGNAPEAIVALASTLGLSVVAGRLIGGWLLDRFWAPAVAFVLLSAPALGLWLLTGNQVPYASLQLAIALIGAAAGIEHDILAYLVARYFGVRSYATIYGVIYAVFALGAGIGPIIFARAYDATGSYAGPLLAAAALLPIGAAALLGLGRYPETFDGNGAADRTPRAKDMPDV